MANKKSRKFKKQFRNASSPRVARAAATEETEETRLGRVGMTAAGAGATSLVGALLNSEGWAPRTIAGALAAVGVGLAWKGDAPAIRSLGAGAMSAAGSQLAMMLIEEHPGKGSSKQPPAQQPPQSAPAQPQPAQITQRQAGELPAGALENAFERAKTRLSLSSSEVHEVDE
jgi:hypothetical protein